MNQFLPNRPGYSLRVHRQLGRRAFLNNSALWLIGTAAAASLSRAAEVRDNVGTPVMRIGLLTDLHYADRPPVGNRFYRETISKLRECVNQFNKAEPDFVIELGDFIDAADSADQELEHLKTIEAQYARVRCPRHYVLGNHCVWSLTKQQFADNCGAGRPFYSFDQGAFHFIVLDACYRGDGVPYGERNFVWTDTEIPPDQREWLKGDLRNTKNSVIVFIHQRLDVETDYAVKSAPAVRGILESSGKVLAVFQGHYHKNDYREINGIHYCTLAAMIEGSGLENSAYGLMSVFKDGRLKVEGFRQQKSFEVP